MGGGLYRAKWRKNCNVEEIITMRATFLIRCRCDTTKIKKMLGSNEPVGRSYGNQMGTVVCVASLF